MQYIYICVLYVKTNDFALALPQRAHFQSIFLKKNLLNNSQEKLCRTLYDFRHDY